METIFDIAAPAELTAIMGEPFESDTAPYETEREFAKKGSDTNFVWLAELYAMRGNMAQANKCLEAIKDDQTRLDTMLIINHP